MKSYRCTLMKGGRSQVTVRLDEDRIGLSGLSKADERRVSNMGLGDTYTDADGDVWFRVK